jgi:hypothetical protein
MPEGNSFGRWEFDEFPPRGSSPAWFQSSATTLIDRCWTSFPVDARISPSEDWTTGNSLREEGGVLNCVTWPGRLMPRSIDTAELSEVAIVTMALNTQASRRKPKSDAIIHQ